MEEQMGNWITIQIKIPNIVSASAPLLQKKWVKVKYVPTEEELMSARVD